MTSETLPRKYTIEVPTEDGRKALIDVLREWSDVYVLKVAGELLDATPEAVTAAVQMAFLELQAIREGDGT